MTPQRLQYACVATRSASPMTGALHKLAAAALLVLAACSQPAPTVPADGRPARDAAESFREFGDYVVHFNALSTEQLTPEIARQYGIVRSGNRGMLNVSIVRKEAGSTGVSVPGSVSAAAVNLTGQVKNIELREIREQSAVYYIAEFPVANQETLIFTIDVTPLNEQGRFSVRYTRQFFTD